jgi:hypothetical protein
VGWIELAMDGVQWRTVMNMVMNLRVPKKMIYFLSSWATISFPGKTTPWSYILVGDRRPLHVLLLTSVAGKRKEASLETLGETRHAYKVSSENLVEIDHFVYRRTTVLKNSQNSWG